MFASGGAEGSIFFWLADGDKEVGALEQAHDGIVWSLDWHPLGHILCSTSSDFTTRFWTRNRPGDAVHDKFVLGQQVAQQMGIHTAGITIGLDEDDEALPGLGGEPPALKRPPPRPAPMRPPPPPPMPAMAGMAPPPFPPLPPGFPLPPGMPPLPPGMRPPASHQNVQHPPPLPPPTNRNDPRMRRR